MKILFVCAMAEELSQFFVHVWETKNVSCVSDVKPNLGICWRYRDKVTDTEYIAVATGIAYASAVNLAKVISDEKPDRVINFGTCASLSDDYPVGSVIVAKRFRSVDYKLSRFGYIDGTVSKQLSEDKGPIQVSGSYFLESEKDKADVLRRFPGAVGFDMESYMYSRVCEAFNLPFVSVRAISDLGSDSDFQKNLAMATRKSLGTAFTLVDSDK